VKQVRPHLFVLCLLAAFLLTGMHTTLQNALTDLRFSWFSRQASGEIVLVAIDSPSLEKIGVWPWPRRVHAGLVDKLRAEASEIAFDVDFSSPSDPASDRAFVEALKKAGGSVVLPSFQQQVGDRGKGKTIHVNRPLPAFSENAWSALVNVAVEADGKVRYYPYGKMLDEKFVPSVAALLAGRYEKNEGSFLIDFSIRGDSVPAVSYVDVLQGDPDAIKKIKGKKVIVGGTALELGDRFYVPNGRVISGVLLQAIAAESILQGRTLRPSSSLVALAAIGLLALAMAVLWRRHSAGMRIAFLVGLAVVAECIAVILQAKFPVILETSLFHMAVAAYLAAIMLEEIDFRDLLGRIANRRFQLIAMSFGDGLVCADETGAITVWNRGAAAIFGYQPEEMIGRPLDKISAKPTFSIHDLPREVLQVPGGKVMELDGRRKNGEIFPLEACFSGWQGVDGFQFGAVLRDISVRKHESERIRYLAEYDTLTGLANRITLHERLDAKLTKAANDQSEVALLVMGLDKFKEINDSHGATCGDEVLCSVAKRLNGLIEGAGLVARLGGDEFAVVITGSNLAVRAENLCERMSYAFGRMALSAGAPQFHLTCSIGVAVYPKDCATADELLGNADLALHKAKASGRGKYVFFDRGLRNELETRVSLERQLERAVEADEFELYYQPQVDLASGKLIAVEALIRWRHPDRGIVAPDDFMPAVNASPLSDTVAQWVLETACQQARQWQEEGHRIRIAVNLAPSQLQSDDLAPAVLSILHGTGLAPDLLELEITEDILFRDDLRALEVFRQIRDLGVNIAFDDFGTGYASLTYLKKFCFERLKIDRGFVRDLRVDPYDAAIVATTIELGNRLGLKVVAEGIEDRATADLLLKMGCKEGQGFYFGRPMPVAQFEEKFLSSEAPLVPELRLVKSPAAVA
jgi:diguanylate cyclase (GGDEF)-like protein/PAS domain S-box-containing protein